MVGFIENLRKKPEPYRRRVTFLASLLITGVIFVAWLIVALNVLEVDKTAEEVSEKRTGSGPVESLFGNFRSGIKEIGEQVDSLRDYTSF